MHESREPLAGKVALVTGSSKGIGAGSALCLARHGADVVINHRQSPREAEDICERIRSFGRRAIVIQADVSDRVSVESLVQRAEEALGPIDILVNNAGFNPLRSILDVSEEDWDWMLNLNLKAYFRCTRAVLPGMMARREGRIVNISSISGQRGGFSCDVDYSAAKAGILGLTRALARWATQYGVLVNAVAPGYIQTSMGEARGQHPNPDLERRLMETVPLRRYGTPEEIGEVVAFLAGPGASYIVGEVISVNGGVHMS
jgi:3-oxoacyl-[acyl-carrier protein] reductase